MEPSAITKVSALGIDGQRVKAILRLAGAFGDYGQLGHGFQVIARLTVWRTENALTIPVGALFRDGSDSATLRSATRSSFAPAIWSRTA